MTELEELQRRIDILEAQLRGEYKALDNKVEGFADTFTIAFQETQRKQDKLFPVLGLVFSVLSVLLIGIQIALTFFKP